MKLINISIAIENFGIFYVDQYMKISFFQIRLVLDIGKAMFLN
ncbi:hypothetical protein KFSEC3_00048 [Escherichia virus KFS-EC3]|nr:hypothetical protein KFSEC3_00048 [Escherichia virus KFS-EC3]